MNATPAESNLLDSELGAALIEVVRCSFETSGDLVEAVRARYIGSWYVYRVELTDLDSDAN